jgi:hypothetical protein
MAGLYTTPFLLPSHGIIRNKEPKQQAGIPQNGHTLHKTDNINTSRSDRHRIYKNEAPYAPMRGGAGMGFPAGFHRILKTSLLSAFKVFSLDQASAARSKRFQAN